MMGAAFSLLGVASVGIAFWNPMWGWVLYAAVVFMLLTILASVRRRQWFDEIPGLSRLANAHLRKFGHSYSRPYAAASFSRTASLLVLLSIALGAVSALTGFWWGIALAAASHLILGPVAAAFNPTQFFTEPDEIAAHTEIVTYFQQNPPREPIRWE